jgi:hypothetical protein
MVSGATDRAKCVSREWMHGYIGRFMPHRPA